MKNLRKILVLLLVLLLALSLAACGEKEQQEQQGKTDDPVIINPGLDIDLSGAGNGDAPDQPEFEDKGVDTTIDDLVAKLDQITSYYMEETIVYPEYTMLSQTWRLGDMTKYQVSMNGRPVSVFFYDWDSLTYLTYSYGDTKAVQMPLSASDDLFTTDPMNMDFSAYTMVGVEMLDEQTCVKLIDGDEETLWLSTYNGMPVRMDFYDNLQDAVLSATYGNITLNRVSEADVTIPDNLEISYISSN